MTVLPSFIGQVSLLALRIAVGMVSLVDLPCNEYLAALANSASTDLLGTMGTTIPVSSLPGTASTLPGDTIGDENQPPSEKMQKEGYMAMCQFMQEMENPSTLCCRPKVKKNACVSCGSTRTTGCSCVNWRAVMVRVPNGKGGEAWVKKTNEEAYATKIRPEAGESAIRPKP